MILFFLIGVISVFAFSLLCLMFWQKVQPKVSSTIVVGLTSALLLGLLFLIATGRLHWLAGIVTALLPFVRRGLFLTRFIPLLGGLRNAFGGSMGGFDPFGTARNDAPDTSETQTSELKMELNHQTQELSGTVLKGTFTGRTLASLSKEELLVLYAELEEQQSIRLLSSFINRYHPDIEVDTADEDDAPSKSEDTMDVAKACAILGVEETASKEEIIEAYKRLIQRLHPDKGGSSYLSSELNEAKKVLLERFP